MLRAIIHLIIHLRSISSIPELFSINRKQILVKTLENLETFHLLHYTKHNEGKRNIGWTFYCLKYFFKSLVLTNFNNGKKFPVLKRYAKPGEEYLLPCRIILQRMQVYTKRIGRLMMYHAISIIFRRGVWSNYYLSMV